MTQFFKGRPGLPLAIFGAMFVLYSLTLTQVHTFDAYSYAAAVQIKPWRETFHPHHLIYGPLGALGYATARALGYAGPALLPLQLINALAGSAGVALWAAIVRRATTRRDLALLGAGLLGAAYAWWYYAIEVEVYTLAGLFLIAGAGVLLRLLREPGWRAGWLWLGLAQSGAILFHQTNVLWAAPVLAGWLAAEWPAALGRRERALSLARYALVAAVVVGGAYAWVMFGLSGFRSWAQVRAWLFEYAATGFWGGPVGAETLARLGQGWSLSLAPFGGGLILLGLAGLVAASARRLWSRRRPQMIVAAAWLAAYGLFFAWWEADNIEFWIASLPPLSLLVVLAVAGCQGRTQRLVSAALALIVAVLLVQNTIVISQRGDSAADSDRRIATALAASGGPDDLYLVPNGLQELYLRYEFGRPNTLALSLEIGRWDRACAILGEAIATTTGAGYRVWIDHTVLEPPPALLRRYHLDAAAVRACLAPFASADQRDLGEARYALLSPAPGGQPDWRWDGWTLGWQANFIRASAWDGGWSFIPEDDPHLLSPRLGLDSADWSAIEITMATDLPAQRGQFYWIAPGGAAGEERSASWEVIADGQPHTYTIELRDLPGWSGPLGLLRIDPVGQGDGRGRVTMQRVRLLP